MITQPETIKVPTSETERAEHHPTAPAPAEAELLQHNLSALEARFRAGGGTQPPSMAHPSAALETAIAATGPYARRTTSDDVLVAGRPFGPKHMLSVSAIVKAARMPQSTVSNPGPNSVARGPHAPPWVPLGPITSSRIRIDLLPTVVKDCSRSLHALIRSPIAFAGLFKESGVTRRSVVRSHGFSQDNVKRLLDAGVVRQSTAERALVQAPVFTVMKANGTEARFIADMRFINDHMAPPPEMWLDAPDKIISDMLQFARKWPQCAAATTDAISAFYQFPVHPDISKYFSMSVNRARGAPAVYELTVLAMGWSYAPAIVQRFFRSICEEVRRRVDGVYTNVWLDNFVFLARDDATLRAAVAVFEEIAAVLNVALHDFDYATDTLTFIGLNFDLRAHTVAPTPKWARKAQEATTTACRPKATYRQVVRATGCIIWASYVRRMPLATLPETMKGLRALAVSVQRAGWEASWEPPEKMREEMIRAADKIAEPAVIHVPDDVVPAFADASEDGWGIVCGDTVLSGVFSDALQDTPIFYKELVTAMSALCYIAKRGAKAATLFVDNSSVVHAVRSGNPRTALGARIFTDGFAKLPQSFLYGVKWVPTTQNVADAPSRVLMPSEHGPLAPDVAATTSWPSALEPG